MRYRLAWFLAAFLFLSPFARPAETNVLLITIDTLRTDRLSCYGGTFVKTPQIDALAAQGTLFERAFAHDPTTLPSHANILTGMTPPFHGVRENAKAKLPQAALTLAELLRTAGFATAAFVGAFPLDSRFGLDQGFEIYDDSFPALPVRMGTDAERRAEQVVRAAGQWISRQGDRWFCWIHLWDPHAPYAPPEPFFGRYKDDLYSGEVAYVDSELGRLLGSLRTSGRIGQTLIILTADHGESLGEHGEMTHSYFAYNSTIHVPLIIAGPGLKPIRIMSNVSHADIFPTVCDLVGISPPKGLQGRSLVALIRGGRQADLPVYFESLEPYLNKGCAPLRGFIEGRTKYMDSPVPEVYDLATDFTENTNLAGRTDIRPLKAKLDKLLGSLASPLAGTSGRPVDSRTLEKLRSLGYVASPVAQTKATYGPADDLKNFLPFEQRLERAVILSAHGDSAAGIRELRALIEERKGFAPAYVYLFEIYRAQGRMAEAVEALESGVKANPEEYALLSSLGTSLVRAGQYDRAADVLDRAIAIVDFDPALWDTLGMVLMHKGEYAKALEHMAKALELDPTFALAFCNIGTVHMEMFFNQGRRSEEIALAIEAFHRAIALDPRLGLAYRGLGFAYRAGGDRGGALEAWEKAIALDPADSFSTFHLGLVCLERGEKARAKSLFEKYLDLMGPGFAAEERAKVRALIEKCK